MNKKLPARRARKALVMGSDDEKEAVASLKEQDEASSPGTIGDLIKAQMDDQ